MPAKKGEIVSRIFGIALVFAMVGVMLVPLHTGGEATQNVSQTSANGANGEGDIQVSISVVQEALPETDQAISFSLSKEDSAIEIDGEDSDDMTEEASSSYDRQGAYDYAKYYWNKVCSDGYFFEESYPPSYLGDGTPVPSACGYDCAHFVSCCIGNEPHNKGGGLEVPSRTEAYGEPGADKLRNWLIDSGNAEYKTSIDELEKGDVISYDLDYNGYFDHTALYLGSRRVATHSWSYWNVNWDLGGDHRFIHIISEGTCDFRWYGDGVWSDKSEYTPSEDFVDYSQFANYGDTSDYTVYFYLHNPSGVLKWSDSRTSTLMGGYSSTWTVTISPGDVGESEWQDGDWSFCSEVKPALCSDLAAECCINRVANHPPDRPTNIEPLDGATGVSLTPTLRASAFSDPDLGDWHWKTWWDVRKTDGTLIWDSGWRAYDLTSTAVPSGLLDYGTTYKWRVRYMDNHGAWSEPSPIPTTFTTAEEDEPDIQLDRDHLDFGCSAAESNSRTAAASDQLDSGSAAATLASRETPPGGKEIEMILLDSPPTPPVDVSHTIVNVGDIPVSSVTLNDVPKSEWTYGCAATSAGMLFGYYDRIGYPNMYTGPTNGGVCPLTDLGQGIPGDARYPIPGSCYIIATENGLDGISTNAHADDYWISYGSAGPDPWEGNWPEHTWELCTADFLGTNQWKWDYGSYPATDGVIDYNVDGGTAFWVDDAGSKLYDWCPGPAYGTPTTSFCHGLRLFAESRGYSVDANYNQLTDNQHPDGFTFAEFQAEIDAGRPVLVILVGHAMAGVGYDAATNTIYVHDTWDNDAHNMTWGGSYAGMDLLAVTVMHLAPPGADCQTITVSNVGDADLIVSDIEIGYQSGEPTGWLDANPKSFTVLPDSSQVVTVCVDCTGLSSGGYHGWLDIRSNDPDEDPYRATVTLTIVGEAELCYSPTSHDFGDKCEGETDSTTFEIWNCGTGTLSYSLSESCNWVDVQPTSGSSTGEHDTVTVDIDTTGLSEGSHACDISISSNGGVGTFSVTVNVIPCANKVYLDPQHSIVPFCSTRQVEIRANATAFQAGQIKLVYNSNCADATNWLRNTTDFPMGTWDSDTPGEEWITFAALAPLSGDYLLGTLTIHCVCVEECATALDFVEDGTTGSALFDDTGSEISATWQDGTFECVLGVCGDVAPYPDCDGIINMGDVVLLINYVGHPGLPPPHQLCCDWCGDVAPCPTSDGIINMGDVVLLLNYVGHPGEYELCCE